MKNKSFAYYNEIDPFAAQWLRELIAAGHIADGIVDERSIEDVRPDELLGYTQCHFFAGIGVWSYALRQSGWPDDLPVWTGSCPCQPFSTAGKGDGFDDERHLWPSFQWLIQQCQPSVVFGEQVASKAVNPWIDLVQADMEAMGYAFGCVPFPSAGVGAPHIRDRAYWVGHTNNQGPQRHAWNGCAEGREREVGPTAEAGVFGGVADHQSQRWDGGQNTAEPSGWTGVEAGCADSGVGNTDSPGSQQGRKTSSTTGHRHTSDTDGCTDRPSPTNGFWRDADWLGCRDGKWRPVEPGTFPLVDGAPARVGRLRGYGNAINSEAAKEFIAAFIESQQGPT